MEPRSEVEVAEAVASAKGPLVIQGGGTRSFSDGVAGDVLSVAGLSGLTLYEPGALTLVARAGTTMAEVEETLAAEGQRLPFEPMDHRRLLGTEGEPTIGGVVAANVSGPRRIQAGACRDSLIGVRFVDGRGTILRNGGRVMKNVTGYDLVKLMAGSHGTLGVLTEVAFKVLPVAESVGMVSVEGLPATQAVAAMSRALGSPYEVTGAAHLPSGPDGEPLTMVRVEGFAASVTHRLERLTSVLAEFGPVETDRDPERVSAAWKDLRDVATFAGRAGDVWRISVKPTEGPAVADALPEAEVVFDWGGGLIWALLPEGTDARAALNGRDGHATLVRASSHAKGLPVFHPEPPAVAALSSGLRAKFDPRGVLNPGLMG
ncbi:FAD-binding protein [Tropicimonas isoalkanivorans]|uniref:FAD-binding protein n=1 Tax=Tropicimonas isoalkanivorans TaxID=441112 RepID=UPI000B867F4A|nr:FAD-binding protein [Tropicimonas isoalkanivorans]